LTDICRENTRHFTNGIKYFLSHDEWMVLILWTKYNKWLRRTLFSAPWEWI
jgi:hypothetical protein